MKADQMKRTLENAYDFTVKKAFAAIDDWNYGYLDQNNIKRFLRAASHVATKAELVGILRRFDIDGDQKINLKEFELGIKSSLAVFPSNQKPCRPHSSSGPKKNKIPAPKKLSTLLSPKPKQKSRPVSAVRTNTNRKRENELQNRNSKPNVGPNSSYFMKENA